MAEDGAGEGISDGLAQLTDDAVSIEARLGLGETLLDIELKCKAGAENLLNMYNVRVSGVTVMIWL